MRQGRFIEGQFVNCVDAPCIGRLAAENRGCTCGFFSDGDVVFAAQHRVNAGTRAEFMAAMKAAPKTGGGYVGHGGGARRRGSFR
jgi:hypothetical protein